MTHACVKPITIGNCELKNRIFFAPTTLGLKPEEKAAKLNAIAQGQTALIILPDIPVLGSGSLQNSRTFAAYQQLISQLHQQGAKVSAQLHLSDANFKAMLKWIPALLTHRLTADQLRQKLNDSAAVTVNQMREKRIREILAAFGLSAQQAQAAGFDMIQVHGDRLIGSFSSSLINKRTDEYGGCLENRMRFALEAVRQVRQHCSLPVDYKLAVRQINPDYGKAGVLEQDLDPVVGWLEQAGVDCFHVTLANHGALTDTIPPANHPAFSAEGCFLKFADQVKALTCKPVIGVGNLRHPEFNDQAIENGRIDAAAMSRQLIADPDWTAKLLAGHPETIRYCAGCNQKCLQGLMSHQGIHCIYDQKRSDIQ